MSNDSPAIRSGRPLTRRRVGTRVAAATAAAAITALMLTTDPTGAKPQARGAVAPIKFFVKQTALAAQDPSFPKAGDVLVTTSENLRGGHRIGTDHTGCFVVDAAGTLQCQTTVGLPGGTLEIAYLDTLNGTAFTAAVTGGTGRYATARGSATLRQTSGNLYQATVHVQ